MGAIPGEDTSKLGGIRRVAWLVPVLAERAPDQSYFWVAVLLHARTFGPIQAAR